MNTAFDVRHLTEDEVVVQPAPCAGGLVEHTPEDMLFARLPHAVRAKALLLEKHLLEIATAGKRGRGKRIAALAAQLGKSVVNTRVMFDRYVEGGRMAIVDRRAAGCLRESVPVATVEWWKGIAEKNGANVKRAFDQTLAWWRLGKPIPGYAYPPAATITGLPKGWSLQTFYRLCGFTQYERSLSRVGRAAAKGHLPLVLSTRADLRCGQILMFDDVWHDVETHEIGINRAPVRPLELCCLDVFSASKIAYGLFPRRTDEDTGKRINLRDSHMRFLLAYVLTQVGIHPRGCRLVVEHGTAAISEEFEQILIRESKGLISVVRGGIQDAPSLLGAWGGPKRGNFRVKAALESAHRLPHLWAKHLIGQTGSNSRIDRPEELTGREVEHERLSRALVEAVASGVPGENIAHFLQSLSAPLLPFASYSRIIEQLYRIIDCRTEHGLEGWEEAGLVAGEFKLKLDSPQWLPDAMFEQLADKEIHGQLAALINANAGFHRFRRLSPFEVWQSERKQLVRLPAYTIPTLLGPEHARAATVSDRGTIEIEDRAISISKLIYIARARDFFGHEILLRPRTTYQVFCNPFDGDRLFVCDERLRPVGICTRQVTVSDADMDQIRAAQGQAAHEEIVRLQPYRQRHAADAAAAIAAKQQNTAAIAELLAKNPAALKAAAEQSAEQAIAATDTEDVLDALRKRATELSTQ